MKGKIDFSELVNNEFDSFIWSQIIAFAIRPLDCQGLEVLKSLKLVSHHFKNLVEKEDYTTKELEEWAISPVDLQDIERFSPILKTTDAYKRLRKKVASCRASLSEGLALVFIQNKHLPVCKASATSPY